MKNASIKCITVTLNPCFDVTMDVQSLENDAENRIKDELRDIGGKGVNVSRVFDSISENPSICITVADNSREFESLLKEEVSNYKIFRTENPVRENLVLRCGDSTVRLNRAGAPFPQEGWEEFKELLFKNINAGDIVLFGGSLPKGFDMEKYKELIKDSRELHGARVVVDSSAMTFADYEQIKPWLIKPNIHELDKIEKLQSENLPEILRAAKKLHKEAGVENVMVSVGGDGIVMVNGTGAWQAPAVPVPVKSTVGAGDSALAGFIYSSIMEEPMTECLKMAAICGAGTVMHEGTSLATRADVEELLELWEKKKLSVKDLTTG